ncbi:type II CAAX endopeptidase family protein [uncultured Ilyobacter sp.]|uniref:CPBP family intramembrane glutamic endopeptidase n=1 Tax=uncultured Ilyobacter sp. TaxID=544433 RepID=UPI0029C8FE28|nr:type II CAAX endopeptidase family protein [uncultured Ilyobacter sp.]
MLKNSSEIGRFKISTRSLMPFLLITFIVTWTILGLYIFLPNKMTSIFGKITGDHPMFFLAVYSPAIAAIIVVLHSSGIKGVQSYLRRVLIWRSTKSWYTFLILGIPLIFISGSALKGNLFTEPFQFSSFHSLFMAFLLTAIKGPVEELGWRGVALPLLQRNFTPIWAAFILGIIWAIWHLPAFLLSGTPQEFWPFIPFFFGAIALSVIVTALFNGSKGSILIPMLFHFFLNNPIWPNAQPYDIYLFVVAAFFITWFNRKTMFTKEGAVTRVIPFGLTP